MDGVRRSTANLLASLHTQDNPNFKALSKEERNLVMTILKNPNTVADDNKLNNIRIKIATPEKRSLFNSIKKSILVRAGLMPSSKQMNEKLAETRQKKVAAKAPEPERNVNKQLREYMSYTPTKLRNEGTQILAFVETIKGDPTAKRRLGEALADYKRLDPHAPELLGIENSIKKYLNDLMV